jgi:hypothetical protein
MEMHFGRSESYERVVLKNEDYREDYMVYVGGVEECKETYEGKRGGKEEWKNERRRGRVQHTNTAAFDFFLGSALQ